MPGTQAPREGGTALIAPVLGASVAGAALQLQQPTLWPVAVYVVFTVAGLALLALSASRRLASPWPVLLALTGALLAGGGACGWRAQAFASQALAPALEGRDLRVTGVVAAMPQRNETGLRFRLAVESAWLGAQEVRLPPRLQLGWYGGAGAGELTRQPADLRAGERWQMTVRLKAPHGHLNPHGFDYELWLWEQGVQATGYVRAGPREAPPQRLGMTWQHPVEQARQAVRDDILARVDDRQRGGIVAALVTGDQNAIDRADWDVFRATGVAHLMSISGLHITLFAWVAAAVVGWLWRRSPRLCLALPAQHAALAGGLLLATGYALFSGFGVPAQRTVWMLATVAALRFAGLRWPWPLVWLLACAVVVALDPWALLQPGFWLSFVAVGVLFATDAGPTGRTRGAAHHVRALLREQTVVTLALTPLTLLLFGQASVVGLVANLLAIPWVTLVVTPLALLGVLAPPLWDAAALAVQALAVVLAWMAALPYAAVSVAAPPLWAGAAGVLGGVVLALRWPWPMRLLGLPLLLPVLLWQPPRPAPGAFELLAADVGQGNAVIVRTAAHTLVYDAGPRYGPESDAGHRVLVPLLRALDERVDVLMLSHRDADHTGGAAAVLAQQPQAQVLGSIEPGHELQALRPVAPCQAGQRWQWDGVGFEVLHPAPGALAAGGKPNTLSCVLRIQAAPGVDGAGGAVALLAGDIEQPQEQALVMAGANLAADVLLVPHHGSKTSSSAAFLDAVQPAVALAQVGYRNRFGHPAPAVLQRYAERGIRVADTPRCGAALWRSDAPQAVQCHRHAAQRYWHHRIP
ncbi:MAG: DNA internalization-related competence protein ComEC/Rec2 [Proteobacteria bacterium]|nr:DNA internalization-related competence protein ComEC/Rec2 [Pseudomonadota bacterium]